MDSFFPPIPISIIFLLLANGASPVLAAYAEDHESFLKFFLFFSLHSANAVAGQSLITTISTTAKYFKSVNAQYSSRVEPVKISVRLFHLFAQHLQRFFMSQTI